MIDIRRVGVSKPNGNVTRWSRRKWVIVRGPIPLGERLPVDRKQGIEMASLEIISYRDPGLLDNHLQLLLHSNHAVPTATDLLAAFFDRAMKFQNSKLVFIDMAIQVLITLNVSLDKSDLLEHRSTIIHRLNDIVIESANSDWLSITEHEGPSMTQIYRYIVRSATSDSRTTRESLKDLLPPALSFLAQTVSKNQPNACIAMELAEYYLLNLDSSQAQALLVKAIALFTQHDNSEPLPHQSSLCHQQLELAHQDPEKRISKPRLLALLQAAGYCESPVLSGDDASAFVARLINPSTVYPTFANAVFRSLWDFLVYSTPIDVRDLASKGIENDDLTRTVDLVIDELQKTNPSDILACYEGVERLRMWAEQIRLATLISNRDMMLETDCPASGLPENFFTSVHTRTDLVERIEFAFKLECQSLIPISKLSGKDDDILDCVVQIAQKCPEKLARLLLDSDKSTIVERFVRASPSTAFSIAALLSLIANNLQQSPLNIEMSLYGVGFADVKVKRLLTKLKIPPTIVRAKVLKCLRGALISSVSVSPDIITHLKAIAIVLYSESDFANCTRVLLTIIRVGSKENFLNNPVLTDPTYFEMLMTSLSQNGEYFDAAVLCQLESCLDLERGTQLLMTSPRRFQIEMFLYILYPELVEALVYAFDKISPDNNKKQVALNLMSRPIMIVRRNHPDRLRLLNDFVTRMIFNPRYSSLENIFKIV